MTEPEVDSSGPLAQMEEQEPHKLQNDVSKPSRSTTYQLRIEDPEGEVHYLRVASTIEDSMRPIMEFCRAHYQKIFSVVPVEPVATEVKSNDSVHSKTTIDPVIQK